MGNDGRNGLPPLLMAINCMLGGWMCLCAQMGWTLLQIMKVVREERADGTRNARKIYVMEYGMHNERTYQQNPARGTRFIAKGRDGNSLRPRFPPTKQAHFSTPVDALRTYQQKPARGTRFIVKGRDGNFRCTWLKTWDPCQVRRSQAGCLCRMPVANCLPWLAPSGLCWPMAPKLEW